MVIPHFGAGHLRVTHPFATLTPRRIQGIPFDLHVLGTPPAFILSQDQTLRKFTLRVCPSKAYVQAGLGPKALANLPITLQLLRSFPNGRGVYHASIRLSNLGLPVSTSRDRLFPIFHVLSPSLEARRNSTTVPIGCQIESLSWRDMKATSRIQLAICWPPRSVLAAGHVLH
jgi:hypothetical protein